MVDPLLLELLPDAKIVLEASARIISHPALTPADREELGRIKRRSYRMVAETIEELLELLDRVSGDPDLEANGDLEPNGDG